MYQKAVCSFALIEFSLNFQVNLESHIREKTKKSILDPTASCFNEAQSKIYILMEKDSYPRFLKSKIYLDLLSQTQARRHSKSKDQTRLSCHSQRLRAQGYLVCQCEDVLCSGRVEIFLRQCKIKPSMLLLLVKIDCKNPSELRSLFQYNFIKSSFLKISWYLSLCWKYPCRSIYC